MELPWNQTCARAQKLLIEESTLEIRFALGSKHLVEETTEGSCCRHLREWNGWNGQS